MCGHAESARRDFNAGADPGSSKSKPAERKIVFKPPYSFPKKVRLITAKQFRRVFSGPLKFQDRNFRVFAVENGKEYPRLGLAVSKRVDKRAVGRNRIKRLIRESFRIRAAGRDNGAGQLAGLDVVIVVKPAAAVVANKELHLGLAMLWKKLDSKRKKSLDTQNSDRN